MIICCHTEINHQWSEPELADKLNLLPVALQQQALRKRLWVDKQLSIAGKLLLLQVMRELRIDQPLYDLKYTEYHRPYFYADFDFNIAHSGNIVVCCGTLTGRVGIDIEKIKEINITDYSDYFTPDEWRLINSYPDKHNGFYDMWTRKEAVLKAMGTGLNTSLLDIDVVTNNKSFEGVEYYIRKLDINKDYSSHIVSTEDDPNIILVPVAI
ncbi:MAG: 4'-phosphopantetheinyl transferase superfamily protein [Mucilaginibacter sp.]